MSWRNDIAVIKTAVTGTVSGTWRENILSIAKARGLEAKDWRSALSKLYAESGLPEEAHWRGQLKALAAALGAETDLPWRQAVAYIRSVYDIPAEYYRVYDKADRILYDAEDKDLYVRSRELWQESITSHIMRKTLTLP